MRASDEVHRTGVGKASAAGKGGAPIRLSTEGIPVNAERGTCEAPGVPPAPPPPTSGPLYKPLPPQVGAAGGRAGPALEGFSLWAAGGREAEG